MKNIYIIFLYSLLTFSCSVRNNDDLPNFVFILADDLGYGEIGVLGQKRILTPRKAYQNGSDWLVIGRPITKGNIKKNIQKLIDHLSQ